MGDEIFNPEVENVEEQPQVEPVIAENEAEEAQDAEAIPTETEAKEEAEAVPPEENSTKESESILEKVQELQKSLDNLQKCFDRKIATDQHKNQLFDNMHKELVGYQNGNFDKVINSIGLDLILLIDDIKKSHKVYSEKEGTEEDYKKLLKLFYGLVGDLEDILYRQSIESYRIEGSEVDVKRQKIVGTTPTNQLEEENQISERVADGYEKNGAVIRPERVKIYKYVAQEATEE